MSSATCLLLVSVSLAQAAVESEAELKQVLVPYYAREAAKYEFFLDAARQRPLVLEKKPVLIWTNVRPSMGSVFVWTLDGRPELVGCIGSQQRPDAISNAFQEFHSLSESTLPPVELGDNKLKWTPSSPGVTFQDVENAPEPNKSDKLRLTQMRGIARELGGAMKDGEDLTELRLLPQPLYRYSSPDRGVIDGAIFAFVWKGTDPEVLVILEDRMTPAGEKWQIAFARFNFREMWVTRNEKEIWRVEKNHVTGNYISGNLAVVNRDSLPREESPENPSTNP
jgi:hypothetical protein